MCEVYKLVNRHVESFQIHFDDQSMNAAHFFQVSGLLFQLHRGHQLQVSSPLLQDLLQLTQFHFQDVLQLTQVHFRLLLPPDQLHQVHGLHLLTQPLQIRLLH